MTVWDLTHTITQSMPVYPGTEQPILTPLYTVEEDGFQETVLRFFSHTGTHMDAPAHMLLHASTLDALPVENFVGRAAVVDCTNLGLGEEIGPERLEGLDLAQLEFVLFCTGWAHYWGKPEYVGAFPVPARRTAERLAAAGLRGIGVDTISVDAMDAATQPNHRIILGAGMVIVENLTGLEALAGQTITFSALPLKFENADGAPVRAVALL